MATPTPPPKPPAKKGVARIAELQLGRGHVNEVTVFDEGSVSDYAKHCTQLLQVSMPSCLTCAPRSYATCVRVPLCAG